MKAVTLGGGRGGERREGKGGGEEERGRRRREEPFFKRAGTKASSTAPGPALLLPKARPPSPPLPPAEMPQTLPTRHSGSQAWPGPGHWGHLGAEGEPSIWGRGTVC